MNCTEIKRIAPSSYFTFIRKCSPVQPLLLSIYYFIFMRNFLLKYRFLYVKVVGYKLKF